MNRHRCIWSKRCSGNIARSLIGGGGKWRMQNASSISMKFGMQVDVDK